MSALQFNAEDFCSVEASQATFTRAAGDLKNGDLVMINGAPCKVVEIEHIKNGKHGSSKAIYTGIEIFSGNKHKDMNPSDHRVQVPYVQCGKYDVIDIDVEEFLVLMNEATAEVRTDVKLSQDTKASKELRSKILQDFSKGHTVRVFVQEAMGFTSIVGAKVVEVH